MAGEKSKTRSQPADRDRIYTRRALLLGFGQAAAFGVLGARLFDLQVLDAEKYALLAEENRINIRLIAPLRGNIVDRFGQVVASNRDNLQLIIVPEAAGDIRAVLDKLKQLIDLSERDVRRILKTARRQRAFVPITVSEDISWTDFARVNVKGPSLPGIQSQIGALRQYHYGSELSHVLGYVGFPAERDATDDPIVMLPGFRIGKNGVEKAFDAELRGRAGTQKVEVNAGGRVIRELDRENSTQGDEIVLTIDLEVQRFAMRRFGKESGAAVAIDIHNGDILALASVPGFDANELVDGIGAAKWRALKLHPRKPLHNKALRGLYPPGSVFKVAVTLAALEHGVITPAERLYCYGGYFFGGRTFRCWKRGGHGRVKLHRAIKQSCDSYFYEVARRLGVDRIAEMANRLGLGLEGKLLPGAKPGVIPTVGWKRAVIGKPWYGGETLITGIGQGFVLASPLELAVMTARIANGKYQIEPRIVRAIGDEPVKSNNFAPLNISQKSLDLVRAGMNAVTNEPGGTAFRSRLNVNGKKMAGKTGTSQVRRLEANRGRRLKDIKWKFRDHALFIAYAPVDAPRYAVAVVVEHGGGGSRVAAPIARDIMVKILERDPSGKPPYKPGAPVRAAQAKPGLMGSQSAVALKRGG